MNFAKILPEISGRKSSAHEGTNPKAILLMQRWIELLLKLMDHVVNQGVSRSSPGHDQDGALPHRQISTPGLKRGKCTG